MIPSNKEYVKEIKKYVEIHSSIKINNKVTSGVKNIEFNEQTQQI